MLARRLDPEQHTGILIGQHVEQAVRPLTYVANPLTQLRQQRLPVDGAPGRVSYDGSMAAMAAADVALGIFGRTPKAARVVPHKVFQAMALGVPTVTRRSAAIAEFFPDEETIGLVPAGDPEARARAIESLAGDPGKRARRGEAGRAASRAAGHPERIGPLLVEAIGRARDRTAPVRKP
jgi:hypothetical protein